MPAPSCSSKNSWEKYDDFAKTQLSKKVLWSFEMEHMAGFWLGGTTFGKKSSNNKQWDQTLSKSNPEWTCIPPSYNT